MRFHVLILTQFFYINENLLLTIFLLPSQSKHGSRHIWKIGSLLVLKILRIILSVLLLHVNSLGAPRRNGHNVMIVVLLYYSILIVCMVRKLLKIDNNVIVHVVILEDTIQEPVQLDMIKLDISFKLPHILLISFSYFMYTIITAYNAF
ncbi:hypothetical protein L873DRAFT_831501 [Choiromyces venosus 120613-1]|uniref:Uncharacterized protein n=1 Tax=Choiromyces venosus 120613-1 TaxID=1336337 RepID=A0A3N4JPA4_9PEZI|nr:hypothetical protein L873DRAFT_831501 [Choiromyces venosus 120613-1]